MKVKITFEITCDYCGAEIERYEDLHYHGSPMMNARQHGALKNDDLCALCDEAVRRHLKAVYLDSQTRRPNGNKTD